MSREKNQRHHWRRRKKAWLRVSSEFYYIWDYAEKRVISQRFVRRRTNFKWFLAAIYNTINYRNELYISDNHYRKGNLNHAFISILTRSDHLEQENSIKSELKPDIIISSHSVGSTYTRIRVPWYSRISAVGKSLWLSAKALLYGAIKISQFFSVVNMLVKFCIDRQVGRKLSNYIEIQDGSWAISTLSIENMRGAVLPLKKSGVNIVTYQHGVRGHNGGYSEEALSDLCILWTERDKANEIEISKIVLPTKLIVCATHHPTIKTTRVAPRSISKIAYVSSPTAENEKDVDEEMMRVLASRAIQEDGFSMDKIIFCLHPSKTKTDYPFLKGFEVVSGISNLDENIYGFVGFHSTALYRKALEGNRVAKLEKNDYCENLLKPFPGVRSLNLDNVRHLSELFDDQILGPTHNSRELYVACYGNYVSGNLISILREEFSEV